MSTKPSIRVAALGAALAGGAVVGALLAAPVVSGAQQSSASSASSASSPTKRAAIQTQSVQDQADPSSTEAPGTADNSTQPDQSNQPRDHGAKRDPSKGGHVGQNGVKEELLTGDAAEKVKTAALTAVPGGNVERVETDAEGAAYEAHVETSDGGEVTVKLDANFNVTSVEEGHR